MALAPSRLPKARDQMVRLLSDPASPLRSAMPDLADPLARLATQLTAADLWWVASDMAALAVSAAETLPEVRWTAADRPSPTGLLVWDGGIGTIRYQGADLPVDAVTWGPSPDRQVWLWLWVSRARLAAAMPNGLWLGDGVPPLVPMGGEMLPLTAEPYPTAEIPEFVRTPATVLAATWLLAQQPTLAERTSAEIDRSIQRAYGRAGRGEPEVTLLDLRRRYVPSDKEEEGVEAGRRYRHRWVVAGHWRQQWYPSQETHKPIWIADHVKGPDNAPLLATTRVNVWRR